MEPILATFWTTFEALLVTILGQKPAPKGDQKRDPFWNRVPPRLKGPGVAFSGIIREVWKSYWSWNYTLQNTGRDSPFPAREKAVHRRGNSPSLHYEVFVCTTEYQFVLRGISLHYNVLVCTTKKQFALQSTGLHYRTLFCTTQYYFALRSTESYYAVQARVCTTEY